METKNIEEIPMGVMLKFLEISGILFTKDKRSKWWARFFSIYYTVSILVGYIPLVLNILLTDDFFNGALESVHFILAGVQATTKHFNMMFRQDEFLELFGEIQSLWADYESKSADNKAYLRMVTYRSQKKTKMIYTFLTVNIVGTAILLTYFNTFVLGKQNLPVQLWIPLDPDKHGVIICSILQFYLISTGVFAYLTNIVFIISLFEHISTLMEVYIKELRETNLWTRDKRTNAIITHSRIINLINKLRNLMSGQWVIETLFSAAQITLRGYMCIKLAERQDTMLIHSLGILIMIVWAISLLFTRGSDLTQWGEGIHDAVYNLPWYEESIKERQEILFMLSVTSKPLTLNYRGFILFDKEQYLNVIRASFSYLTMLQVLDSSELQ